MKIAGCDLHARQQTIAGSDAGLLLKLLLEDRFPEIWMSSSEQPDFNSWERWGNLKCLPRTTNLNHQTDEPRGY